MLPLNYHHLYYFWVTAKAGSLTKAKDKLLLAQPTLSLQISQLEKFFGKKLLVRGRQGVSLTPEGRAAFERCERIFTEGESLVAALKNGGASDVPVLRLGATKSISREIIVRAMDAVRKVVPELNVTIVSGTPAEMRARLERYTIDLAVSESDLSSSLGPDFRGRFVGAIPVSFVASPRLSRVLKGFPSTARTVPMLYRSPENAIRKQVEDYLTRHRLRATTVAEVEDSDLIRYLALMGEGVGALHELAFRNDLGVGRLERLQRGPTGIKEFVWFSAGSGSSSSRPVRKAAQYLMTRFSLRP